MSEVAKPLVGIIMGSESDADVMAEAAQVLDDFLVPFEFDVKSAHRTPDEMTDYAKSAVTRGLKVIIAGAGGSAHLQGMTASHTELPVISVPVKRPNHDHEALWSNIKMPPGIPLATMPENGAKNAGLLAVRILALSDTGLQRQYQKYVQELHDGVIRSSADMQTKGWKSYLTK